MELRILGPLEVALDGRPKPLRTSAAARLLALLAAHANEVVPSDRLVADLWPNGGAADAGRRLGGAIAAARRVVGAVGSPRSAQRWVITEPDGYSLRVTALELDATAFLDRRDSAQAAVRAHDYAAAGDELRRALALWRGPAFGDLADEPFLSGHAAWLDDARASALEDRIDVDLACGRHVELCDELAELVEGQPRRERLTRQLVLALYRSNRQSDALNVAARYRQTAVAAGHTPSALLFQLEQDVLLQKPQLDHSQVGVRAPVAPLPTSNGSTRDVEIDVVAPTRGLVGRRAERQWLVDRLDEALHGSPQVIVLTGEAGVGKSRLGRELVEEAQRRGVATSIGRFREQQTAPFEAFTDDFFLRLADAARDDPGLARHAQILRRLATFGSEVDDGDRSTDAQRIAAVREGFRHLVRREPLLVLVDDVQWADPASREWLVTLVRLAADMCIDEATHLVLLLILRQEPGVAEVPQLDLIRRETITSTLTLHGLSELDVSKLAHANGVHDLPRTVVAEITRVTRGNPLFVLALAKQYGDRGGPEAMARFASPGRLPSEIQGLVGSRVTSLGADCQEMLAVAAVLGSGWGTGTLEAVTRIAPPTLDALLDEAEQSEVLVRVDGGYDFAHPLYERAALSALSSRRRQEIHGQVASVLIDQQMSRPDGSTMAIAQHLVDAGDYADPEMLVRYCPGAGASAFAGFAWGDAARYYEAAIDGHARTGDDSDESRVALALRACTARLQNGEPAAALRAADAAILALGEHASADEVATVWSARVRANLFTSGPGGSVDTGPLEALVGPLEVDAPATAARVYGHLASVYANVARDVDAARTACQKAIDLGSQHEEYAAAATGWGQLAVTQWMRFELFEAVESLEAEAEHATNAGNREKVSHALSLLPMTLFWLGRLDEAESAIDQARTTTRQVNYFLHDGFVLVAQAAIAAVRGMYVQSDAAVEDAVEIGRLTGDQWPTILILSLLAATRAQRGDVDGLDAVLSQWAPPGSPPDRSAFAWLLRRHVDAAGGAPVSPDELRAIWQPIASPPRVSTDTAAVLAIDLARNSDVPDVAREAAAFLQGLSDRGQVFTTTMGFFIPRALGLAAAVAGDLASARTQLEQSVELADRLRAHAELAACQEALAWVLAKVQGAQPEARTLLDTARHAARTLGLTPLASRCDAQLRALGDEREEDAVTPDPAAPGSRQDVGDMAVVMFTDIANSVQLTEEMGDWAFHDRAKALQASLRATIRTHAGRPVDGIKLGDGILAEFRSAERALYCALACTGIAIDAGMPLHIGAHAGDVIRSDGDIFGGAVNTAARICSTAPAGEVLVSQTLRDLARTSSGLAFTSLGPHTMKGISEPVPLFSVHSH